jgi:hypothetical protein
LTILVQILGSGDIVRHILAGRRLVVLTIAFERPVVETIGRAERRPGRFDTIVAQESHRLLIVDGIGLSAAGCFGLPITHSHDRAVARVAHLNTVLARLVQHHRYVRSVDLVGLVLQQLTHVDDHGAGRDLHLRHVVIKVQEGEAGVGAQANNRATDVELGSRALGIRPQLVTGGQRSIQLRADPILLAGRLQGNGALDIGESRDAPGRITTFVRERDAEHAQGEQEQRQQASPA